jgi:transposase-like protein
MPINRQTIVKKPPASLDTSGEGGHLGQGKIRLRNQRLAPFKGRSNHPIEFRRQLAKLECDPGVSIARLALEHGLNTNLLFKWRRAYRAGEHDSMTLLPVEVKQEERTA